MYKGYFIGVGYIRDKEYWNFGYCPGTRQYRNAFMSKFDFHWPVHFLVGADLIKEKLMEFVMGAKI